MVVGGRVVASGFLFNLGADGYNGAWFVADGYEEVEAVLCCYCTLAVEDYTASSASHT